MMVNRAALLASAILFAASTGTKAHPHVWVSMRSDIVFNDDGLIKGVNLEWAFDDNYTEMALDGLDANADGVYSQAEIAPLTKENIIALKDYDFFTVLRSGGQKQEIGAVTEFGQIWSNGRFSMHFHVPLKIPVDPRQGEFVMKVYDPDFFIAIDYPKDDPVSVLGNMPATCKLDVKPVPTDAEMEQTRLMLSTKGKDWKPETAEDFGAMFAQPAVIACGA